MDRPGPYGRKLGFWVLPFSYLYPLETPVESAAVFLNSLLGGGFAGGNCKFHPYHPSIIWFLRNFSYRFLAFFSVSKHVFTGNFADLFYGFYFNLFLFQKKDFFFLLSLFGIISLYLILEEYFSSNFLRWALFNLTNSFLHCVFCCCLLMVFLCFWYSHFQFLCLLMEFLLTLMLTLIPNCWG